MDKWFAILLGVLVASLYVPAMVIPVRHRELCRRLNTKSFYRRFSPVMISVGIIALLVSNNSDIPHRILFVFGIIETLGGIFCLLIFPSYAVSQVQFLLSKSLTVWIVRGVLKFTLGLLFILWGILYF